MSGKAIVAIDRKDFRRRVLGCWLGKAVGGTLGQPHEGRPGPLDLTFYDPIPEGIIPNDDLDMQVLWLEVVRRWGAKTNRIHLAGGWLEHTDFPWDEYGSALTNFARGIFPPASGHHSNFCGDCMGSPIRSEIWAALAPGDPELACKLAYEDAICDHDGEGIWGELFLAAVESAAFVIPERDRLIEIGLSAIPRGCRIAQVVRSTVDWCGRSGDWRAVREKILHSFGHENFTDAPQNLGFIILGWLVGKDFGDAICTAVNCGQDTDCTGATLGALLGIIDPDCIPQKWTAPISSEIALSPQMKNMTHPKTIQAMTDMTVELAEEMLRARSERVEMADTGHPAGQPPFDLKPFDCDPANSMLLADDGLKITALYPEGLTFVPGRAMPITLQFTNNSGSPLAADVKLNTPCGWSIQGGASDRIELSPGQSDEIALTLSVPADLSTYSEYVVLTVGANGIWADYTLPMVSAWQWQVELAGRRKLLWLPERVLLPLKSKELTPGPGELLRASTSFHFPRKQFVRIILASNGSGTLRLDGKEIISYKNAQFLPVTHRGPRETWGDIMLEPGRHQLELSLEFACDQPKAALLLADAHDCLLIHDVAFRADQIQ